LQLAFISYPLSALHQSALMWMYAAILLYYLRHRLARRRRDDAVMCTRRFKPRDAPGQASRPSVEAALRVRPRPPPWDHVSSWCFLSRLLATTSPLPCTVNHTDIMMFTAAAVTVVFVRVRETALFRCAPVLREAEVCWSYDVLSLYTGLRFVMLQRPQSFLAAKNAAWCCDVHLQFLATLC